MNLTKAFNTLHIAALCTVDIKEVLDEVLENIRDKNILNASLKRSFIAVSRQINELTKEQKIADNYMNLVESSRKINTLISVIYDSKRILTTTLDYITSEELKSKILKILEEIKEIAT